MTVGELRALVAQFENESDDTMLVTYSPDPDNQGRLERVFIGYHDDIVEFQEDGGDEHRAALVFVNIE